MKKTTYKVLASIPLVGAIVKKETAPVNSLPVKAACGSLARERFSEDPRGALAAQMEYIEKVMAPAKEYVDKHPDVQLTAGLINKLYRDNG